MAKVSFCQLHILMMLVYATGQLSLWISLPGFFFSLVFDWSCGVCVCLQVQTFSFDGSEKCRYVMQSSLLSSSISSTVGFTPPKLTTVADLWRCIFRLLRKRNKMNANAQTHRISMKNSPMAMIMLAAGIAINFLLSTVDNVRVQVLGNDKKKKKFCLHLVG